MLKYPISIIRLMLYLIVVYISLLIFWFTDDNSHPLGWDFNYKFNRFSGSLMVDDDGLMYRIFSEEETNKIRPILNLIAYLMLIVPIYFKIILPINKFIRTNKEIKKKE